MEKKLYRIRKGKMIAGVCGGIAKYFNVDPNLIRIICAALILACGNVVLAYILCILFIPKESLD